MKSILIVLILVAFIIRSLACSDFQLKSKDGTIICGRTMDFIMPMHSKILVFNRGINHTSMAPDGSNGLKWRAKYGFVGVNAFDIQSVDEGMNEKGLTCGFLVLNETIYPPIVSNRNNISLAIMDFCTWVLSSFSSTQEVINGIKNIQIWGNKMPVLKIVMGLHIPIHDSFGNNIVIEFINGNINIHDNMLGILTNEPSFPYQLQNLEKYNGLSPNSSSSATINGYQIPSLVGSGLMGLSGSWSSMDRFVRMSTLIRYIENLDTSMNTILTATSILNSVFVPKGMVMVHLSVFDMYFYSYTHWSTMKDLTNKVFYYRNNDGAIRAIYLDKINFDTNANHIPFAIQQSSPFIIDETKHLFE